MPDRISDSRALPPFYDAANHPQRDGVCLQFLNRLMKGEKIEVVPAAEALPMIDETELAELARDILPAQGVDGEALVKVPIVIDEHGRLVDGRNRLRVLREKLSFPEHGQAKLDPVLGDDGFRFAGTLQNGVDVNVRLSIEVVPAAQATREVLSRNIYRRHLKPGERAALVAQLVRVRTDAEKTAAARAAKKGEPSPVPPNGGTEPGYSIDEAAKLAGVSKRTLDRARRKQRRDDPEPEQPTVLVPVLMPPRPNSVNKETLAYAIEAAVAILDHAAKRQTPKVRALLQQLTEQVREISKHRRN
jgi:hypothetical protein